MAKVINLGNTSTDDPLPPPPSSIMANMERGGEKGINGSTVKNGPNASGTFDQQQGIASRKRSVSWSCSERARVRGIFNSGFIQGFSTVFQRFFKGFSEVFQRFFKG